MKRVLLLSPLLLVALAACAEEPLDDPTVTTTGTPPAAGPTEAVVPAEPQPTADGPCPYLDDALVEETNGQRVSKVATSADEPPTCFFYRSDGAVQLTVRIFTGDAAVAKALVDSAAPIATANPAELAGGWTGGAEATDAGAVYAVAKEGTAVVVSTNQEQTIKGKVIAQEAITALGL